MLIELVTVKPIAFDNTADELKHVDNRSADSSAMLPYWDKTDAIMGGITAMRQAGEKFLPKFVDELESEYTFRVSQSKMTNVFRDIVEGLTSKPFEDEISVDSTESVYTDFIEDVDGRGNNITQFANVVFFSGIASCIDWVFVDFAAPDPTRKIRTVEDQKKAGLRPFWSRVLGRNMLEVKSKVINGKDTLTLCRILEPGDVTRVRKFERGEDGIISWTLYKRIQNQSELWMIENQGTLSIDVIPLVPFIVGRRIGSGFNFHPAMQDAADLQIDLYQQESDLKFAKKMTAFPMLAANGITPEKDATGNVKKLQTGPSRILYAPIDGSGKAGSWGYVEPSAVSLKFLADDIKETKLDLREIGRQPLTAQSGNVTVINSAHAASKSKSAVVAWALGLKDTLENALKITGMFLKNTNEPSVTVYTEFDSFVDGSDGMDVLMQMRQDGEISSETLHFEAKRRRYLAADNMFIDERKRLLDDPSDDDDDDDDDTTPRNPAQ